MKESKREVKQIDVKLSKQGELRKQWIKILDKIKKLDNLQIKD